jgi:hypothetical protein
MVVRLRNLRVVGVENTSQAERENTGYEIAITILWVYTHNACTTTLFSHNVFVLKITLATW